MRGRINHPLCDIQDGSHSFCDKAVTKERDLLFVNQPFLQYLF